MENLPSYYTDFSLETISTALGVSVETADVFPPLTPWPVPQWLREMLDRGTRHRARNSGDETAIVFVVSDVEIPV